MTVFRTMSFLVLVSLNTGLAFADWRHTGPFGGNAEIVVMDPQSSTTLLAATKGGLLYRSGDSGETWEYVPFPQAFSATLHALAIHPRERSTFYIGISDETPSKSGVYKTTDSGQTWRLLAGTQGEEVFALAIWKRDPRVMAVGSTSGVHLTRDGGENWKRISPVSNAELRPVVSLAFDPERADIIYAGTPHLPWRTLDGGGRWESIHHGLIDDSDIFSIQVDPASPLRLIAGACSGIYRSVDGGNRWVKLLGIPGVSRRTYMVQQDPLDSKIIYAATSRGLWKTTDDGLTWRQLSEMSTKSLAIDPLEPETVYIATDAGLSKSTDGAETIMPINSGFTNRRLTDVLVAGGSMFASTAYEKTAGGLFRSDDSGGAWEKLADPSLVLDENVLFLAGDKDNLFAGGRHAAVRSTDGGVTWKRLAWKLRGTITAMRSVGTGPARVLLVGTTQGLLRTNNDAIVLRRIAIGDPDDRTINGVFAPSDESSIVVTTRIKMFVSSDRGRRWSSAALPGDDNPIYDIAVQSANGSLLILAATAHGLFRSADSGKTWTAGAGGIASATVSAVAFHPERDEAYLAQYDNIYQSTDGGLSWRVLDNRGLESASIRSLHVDNDLNQILAVTGFRGVFVTELKLAQRTTAP